MLVLIFGGILGARLDEKSVFECMYGTFQGGVVTYCHNIHAFVKSLFLIAPRLVEKENVNIGLPVCTQCDAL